jgi:UDP-N-acetylglucosamine 1-carboxyvinyltransferase
MDKLIIRGGKQLNGTVAVSGSKNAVLPIIAASILGNSPSIINNVPNLADVNSMVGLIEKLGAKIDRPKPGVLVIDPRGVKKHIAPYELVRKMRASICVLGPLLGRFGKAKISMPGGCVIGPRPIDLHLKGIKALGTKLEIEHGYVIAESKKLRGANVYLGGRFGSSVLATGNVIMAAVKATGTTVIENAACEPEVVDLANYLNKIGARIEGAGSHVIKITGVKELNGAEHTVISDRIEAGTYMVAAAITRGDVTVEGINVENMRVVIEKLQEMGVRIKVNGDKVRVFGKGRLRPIEIVTLPYPGFPTDMQAQFMALMTLIPGISIITEKIYTERFMHVPELMRLSADIALEGSTAIIKGVKRLSGAPVMASDLRASAALVIAGLAAKGETEVNRIYHLDRGYEKMDEKLRNLGADIVRAKM